MSQLELSAANLINVKLHEYNSLVRLQYLNYCRKYYAMCMYNTPEVGLLRVRTRVFYDAKISLISYFCTFSSFSGPIIQLLVALKQEPRN